MNSTPKTSDHPFVNLPGHAHIVQIIFANFSELAGLIQLENAAAFDVGGLARFNSQRPGNVVETYTATAITQPPRPHRVECTLHIKVAQVDERFDGDVVRQTSLKDKRQVKSDDVVSDDQIAFRIEISHQRQKILQCLGFVLFLSICIDSKSVFALNAV